MKTLSFIVRSTLLFLLLFIHSCLFAQIYGCLDVSACNFNSSATIENYSCEYPQWYIPSIPSSNAGPAVLTCTPPLGYVAVNQSCANQVISNDTYCVQTAWDAICQNALNVCIPSGCTNLFACNYDPTAVIDDGSCNLGENTQIISVSPQPLACVGGQIILVNGIELCGVTSVSMFGIELSFEVLNNNFLQIVAPPGTGEVDLKITTAAGIISTLVNYSPPQITAFSPANIPCFGGFIVTLSGTNLCDSEVFLDGSPVTVLTNTPTTITFVSPPGNGIGHFEIITPSGISELNIPYAYPQIFFTSPNLLNCGGGELLSIFGMNMCDAQVFIGGTEIQILTNTPTIITCTSPPGVGINQLTVVTPSGTSNSLNVAYSTPGCTDSEACNFNPVASCDNGSCQYLDCNGECGGLAISDDCGNCIVPDITEVIHTFTALDEEQTFSLPVGVDRVQLELYGASGGRDRGASQVDPSAPGGLGGYVYGEMDVTSNFFFINVGRREDSFNGGGSGFQSFGGGATTISQGGNSLANRIAVAGGGGGGRFNGISYPGGAGGGLQGGNGTGPDGGFGTGGTQSAPGTGLSNGNGISFIGGTGEAGGGGGWFGGGAGQSGSGGGGSSYLGNLENAYSIPGVNNGDGYVVIRYTVVEYQPGCVQGCTSSLAVNYDIHATFDDGSCIFAGCTDPLANNFDTLPTLNDGSCIYNEGCTYPEASNYSSFAVVDDGSCAFQLNETCLGDLNGDLVVNGADLLGFLGAFNTSCE